MTECNEILIPFEFQDFLEPNFPAAVFHIKDYDKDLLTEKEKKGLIQRVVDRCKEAGGGKVIIDKGKWLSGPIHLSDNICLELEEQSEIHFSQHYEDYLPVVFTRWEGMECYNYSPLIYANGCTNIAIKGNGKLIGGGQAWWHWKRLQGEAAKALCYAESNGISIEERVYGTEESALRPSFIQFINCKNIVLEEFTIEDGPQWTIHPVYCEDILVKHVTVNTSGPNTDGLNPDSCKNVWIEGCTFATGDDCIAINSGMNEDGWRVGRPCENIVIIGCKMNFGHGAIVIGSGMSGGVQNIFAANCHIKDTMQGIRLKSMRGRGGYVRNVYFENIIINDVTNEAIQISMFYPYSTVEAKNDTPPEFSHIELKNITGNSKKHALEIRGLPESKIHHLRFDSIEIAAPEGIVMEYIDDLNFDGNIKGFC